MAEKQIVILDPVSKPKVTKTSLSPRPNTIVGLRVAMVDNTKPNFSIFLDRVEERLANEHNVSVIRYRKPGRTQPLDPQLIVEIKKKCDIAITGLAD